MPEKAEYTMNRFARMYGMEYLGMASTAKEARAVANLRPSLYNEERKPFAADK